jgi:hypothetical protein
MKNLFHRCLTRKAYKRYLRLWIIFIAQKNQRHRAFQLCVIMHETKAIYQVISSWSILIETKLSDQVLKFMHSNNMNHRTNMFRTWRENVRQRHSMIKKGKYLILRFFIWWRKLVAWKATQQTSAEHFHQSSRYETLRQRLREILRNFRLHSRPRSIWLYLLRRGRLPKAKPGHARTNENNESPETSNHSNTSVQFIQSGTEFSIQAAVSHQQLHLCTRLQLVSTICRCICIAGLKFLALSLYIMAVLLVCSFCASRSVMVIYAVYVICAAVRLFPQIFLYSTFFFHWIGSFIVCLRIGG